MQNTQSMRDDCQLQIIYIEIFLVIFEARMIILFIIKVKIIELTKWSYRSPK